MDNEKIHISNRFGFVIICINCNAYMSPETREYGEKDKIVVSAEAITCKQCGQRWKP